ncbi:MAG: hypothetical protein IID39_03940 [Planctomycetes bacterium]|nr:hypothetical protein [Planctomycetota bacterium]
MNIVVLTAGEPHQRYVVNALHRRHPLRAVFRWPKRSPPPLPTLRSRYWAALNRVKSWRTDGWCGVRERSFKRRLARCEQRLKTRALQRVLGIDDAYPFRSDLMVVEVADLNSDDTARRLSAYDPDVLLLIGSPIIRRPVLTTARLGVLNCHTAMLPRFRGSCAQHWILLTGEHDAAGVTIHWATEELDAGDITAQRKVEVQPGDDPFALRCRCLTRAADAFAETLDELARGRRPGIPQATAAPPYRAEQLTPELRWKCCRLSAEQTSAAVSKAVSKLKTSTDLVRDPPSPHLRPTPSQR